MKNNLLAGVVLGFVNGASVAHAALPFTGEFLLQGEQCSLQTPIPGGTLLGFDAFKIARKDDRIQLSDSTGAVKTFFADGSVEERVKRGQGRKRETTDTTRKAFTSSEGSELQLSEKIVSHLDSEGSVTQELNFTFKTLESGEVHLVLSSRLTTQDLNFKTTLNCTFPTEESAR